MDSLTKTQRSERMGRIKNKHTKPEMMVRRLVFGMGYRYRLHGKKLPGRPDLVFARRKKVIFVHGCFWHRHDAPTCKLGRVPKSRLDFWLPKLEANKKRDELVIEEIYRLGWRVLVVWECELKDVQVLRDRIKDFLDEPGDIQ